MFLECCTSAKELENVFVRIIKRRMRELNVERKVLAHDMGCDISYVNRVLGGKKGVSIFAIERFAKAVGLDVEVRFIGK